MIFTLLRRVFKENTGAHVWLPIAVVALLSVVIDVVPFLWGGGTIQWMYFWKDWQGFWKPWFVEHGRELVGIYLAFAWVVWRSVRRASDVRWTLIGDLSDNLEGADRYFALGTIPLREWFEPNALVYLATIVRQQNKTTSTTPLRHDRVLLFYRDSDFKALQASYLDQHYAKSFSAIHDRFGIPLAYLRPQELGALLSKLKPDERWSLAPYRWFARPRSLWGKRPFRALAKSTTKLTPYAVIEKGSDRVILRFLKDGNSLAVEKVVDSFELTACTTFAALIEGVIYKPTTTELWAHCNFSKYLCP